MTSALMRSIVRETQMRPFCGRVEIAPHPSPRVRRLLWHFRCPCSQPQHIQQRDSGELGTRGDQTSRALMHCGDRSLITLSIADFSFFGASKFRLLPGKCCELSSNVCTHQNADWHKNKNLASDDVRRSSGLSVQSDSNTRNA